MERLRKVLSIFAAAALLAPAGGALAGRPVFQHHRAEGESEDHDHPKQRGARPTKTSVGNLTLRSRALLAKDGNTVVEVTTGPFDKSAPGNISRVHLRAVDPSGRDDDDDKDGKDRKDGKEGKELRFRREYNHLRDGGYFASGPLPGLPHGQNLRIEAKAKGSAHRDEVEAKWRDVVLYRPDLVVTEIKAPSEARTNTTVDILAVVKEGMGDLAAHAQCALLVDGAQVDDAPDMPVNAGGATGCQLAATFTKTGMHTLTVRVQNVVPGDYDDRNNEMTTQILIQNPVVMSYDLGVRETKFHKEETKDVYLTTAAFAAGTPDNHTVTTTDSTSQSGGVAGSVPVPVAVPISHLEFSDSSGGRQIFKASYDNVALVEQVPEVSGYTSEGTFADLTAGRSIMLRRYYDANTNTGCTQFTVTWVDQLDNIVHSVGTCKTMLRCTPGDITTPIVNGLVVPYGDDYTAKIVIGDGTTASYSANPTVPLVIVPPAAAPLAPVPKCTNLNAIQKFCQTVSSTSVTREGSGSFHAPQ